VHTDAIFAVSHEQLWGLLAVALTLIGLIPYIYGMLKGRLKPHLFTWLVWTLMTIIVAAGQVSAGAGAGAWPTIITAILCLIITLGAFRYGETHITRGDWGFLVVGLLAIPIWLITKDPTASVVLATLIDVSAFGPTIRKSWHQPWQESMLNCTTSLAKHLATLFAIANYNLATALFPNALVIANIVVIIVLIWRRQIVLRPVDGE
jgi:hypothetical protein